MYERIWASWMGCRGFDRLEFQNDLVVDEDVHAISAIQPGALVFDRERGLGFEGDVVQVQFMGEASLIGRLQQAGAEVLVDFDGAADHTV